MKTLAKYRGNVVSYLTGVGYTRIATLLTAGANAIGLVKTNEDFGTPGQRLADLKVLPKLPTNSTEKKERRFAKKRRRKEVREKNKAARKARQQNKKKRGW